MTSERGNEVHGAKIDPAERERRVQAVSFARASVGLEGFRLSAEDEARAARFVEGEIDLPTFLGGAR
ncbi:antitoxin VbhA family protein [Burkholderia sp. Ac-20365]|uniref:antitoxin VbhA family protein n=1 Tax=Burkholderia sp. Ac-20365 TaxID=2703897 RepID=UPI00197B88EE|nr:antitoxin VbhA family protein [Burkholderia sp. Ac-20365]MBN3761124.1 antitoxin VbhA family protein [Burkholderia sp. Ac-20365]